MARIERLAGAPLAAMRASLMFGIAISAIIAAIGRAMHSHCVRVIAPSAGIPTSRVFAAYAFHPVR